MLFMKLQIILDHHLISHIVQDSVACISPEWLGEWAQRFYLVQCYKASVLPICSASARNVSGADTHRGAGSVAWKYEAVLGHV